MGFTTNSNGKYNDELISFSWHGMNFANFRVSSGPAATKPFPLCYYVLRNRTAAKGFRCVEIR